MNPPTKEWRGHTWVGWLNLILLRWLCMRLAWEEAEEIDKSGKIISIKKQQWLLLFRSPWRW
jgi:hypothetical protein